MHYFTCHYCGRRYPRTQESNLEGYCNGCEKEPEEIPQFKGTKEQLESIKLNK